MWLLKSLLRQIYSACGVRTLQVACSKEQKGYSYAGGQTETKILSRRTPFQLFLALLWGIPCSPASGSGGISQLLQGVSVLCHVSLRSAAVVSVATTLTGRLFLCVKSSLVATATFQKTVF